MDSIFPVLDHSLKTPLYVQLYLYIRNAILSGDIASREKLPSLRKAASDLDLSITTVAQAYNQLTIEGYIENRPQSGYYVNDILLSSSGGTISAFHSIEDSLCPLAEAGSLSPASLYSKQVLQYQSDSLLYLDDSSLQATYYDPACFDFAKWKKCSSKILSDYSDFLFVEADPRGEAPLRYEISKYIYQARGVRCHPDQIVIGAGTQQLTNLLCSLLSALGIEYAAFEEPGYLPVRQGFLERGFKITTVPLDKDGIQIPLLPSNIHSAAYVSPANQFPTGAIMPIARCYALLDWAQKNDSFIIEDDYNSELRYFGKASPSLQGMDNNHRVVYLGSFSSTLFPSVKISYMVLPDPMLEPFSQMTPFYTQTCSKTEQLTLALYMKQGFYRTNIKKLRSLYTQKMQLATNLLKSKLGERVDVLSNSSGLHMLLAVSLPEKIDVHKLCQKAGTLKLSLIPVTGLPLSSETKNRKNQICLIFYYTRIPLEQMEVAITQLAELLLANSPEMRACR